MLFIFMPRHSRSDSIRIDMLLTSVKSVSELITLKAFFETIADREDASTLWGFKIPGTSRKFAVIFSGEVSCGFDLSRMKIEPAGEGKIKMTLPHGKISVNLKAREDDGSNQDNEDTEAQKRSVRVYHQQAGILSSSLSLDDQNKVK